MDYEVYLLREDPKVIEAKRRLTSFIENHKTEVFYMKQVEIIFEKEFFHWITARAINELIDEGELSFKEEPLARGTRVKFLFHPSLRYHKRQINRKIKVIRKYSIPMIARAVGRQAEVLFFNALVARGFIPKGQNVKRYEGKEWTRTGHDLDFILERDGKVYGCEVKNTFDYIDREELGIKLEICEYLGLIPLFIMRFAPKSYIHDLINKKGGFALLFETQIYPFGQEALVKEIKEVLGLPVDCPASIPSGIIDRFEKWHKKRVKSR